MYPIVKWTLDVYLRSTRCNVNSAVIFKRLVDRYIIKGHDPAPVLVVFFSSLFGLAAVKGALIFPLSRHRVNAALTAETIYFTPHFFSNNKA